MATNVDWASKFFESVTSKLPDLLTKHGEGKEMAALDELRAELGKEADAAKAARAKELQAELDVLSGKAPAPVPPQTPPTDEGSGGAEAKPEATGRGKR